MRLAGCGWRYSVEGGGAWPGAWAPAVRLQAVVVQGFLHRPVRLRGHNCCPHTR